LSEVKTYRVEGVVRRGFRSLTFVMEVRGLSEKEALKKFYDEVGSRNKLKRKQIKILGMKEINPAEAKSPVIRLFSGVEEG